MINQNDSSSFQFLSIFVHFGQCRHCKEINSNYQIDMMLSTTKSTQIKPFWTCPYPRHGCTARRLIGLAGVVSAATIVHVLHDVQHDNVMMCVNQLGAHVDAEADCLGTELAMI